MANKHNQTLNIYNLVESHTNFPVEIQNRWVEGKWFIKNVDDLKASK